MAIRPNINDYENDVDYVVACECYGLEMEYEEEARMAEELAELLDSNEESNNSSVRWTKVILDEFANYWTRTYVGLDFNSYKNGELKCDVVEINDSQVLVVCNEEQLDELQNLLETLIRDYDLSTELSLMVTTDFDKWLFDYEKAMLIEDITE